MIPSNHKECASTTRITRASGLDKFGTYNSLPEPAREIDVDTFTRCITRESIVGIETRQPRDLSYSTLKIFWLGPGNGVGMSRQWIDGAWENVHWFFGCEHKLTEHKITRTERDQVGLFIHEYICDRCGYKITVDSSG